MALSYSDETEPGMFARESGIFDKQQISELQVGSDQFKRFLVDLQDRLDEITPILNKKESGIYAQTPDVNGNLYYPSPAALAVAVPVTSELAYRQASHVEIDCGALLDTAKKTIAHGISGIANGYTFTRIYGATTNPTTNVSYPLPHVSATAAIEVSVDATKIYITTTSNLTAWTTSRVYLEWLQE